jgi:predicted phage gp36 major capsid-like protein
MTDMLDKQIKNVTTMVEQQIQKLREEINSELQEMRRNIGVARQDMEVTRDILKATPHDLEATRREFESQLAAVEARTTRGGGGNVGTRAERVKPLKFDGSASWAVFRYHSMPRPITSGHRARRTLIYSPYSREKLLTPYILSQPE